MPSADSLLSSQPKAEFVALISHRIHSVLGSAWHSITNPMSSWMPKLQTAVKAPRVAVEEAPEFVERALQTVFQERGWTWGEGHAPEEELGGRVMLYNVLPPKPALRNAGSSLETSEISSVWATQKDLFLCAASDVALTTIHPPRTYVRETESPSFVYDLTRPHVAMVTLPNRDYRGLDDGFSYPEVHVEAVPTPLFSSQGTQLLTLAAVATGLAIASSVTALGSLFKKPW